MAAACEDCGVGVGPSIHGFAFFGSFSFLPSFGFCRCVRWLSWARVWPATSSSLSPPHIYIPLYSHWRRLL